MRDAGRNPGQNEALARDHPGADELKQFGAGQTEDELRAETIALHLESCAECATIVRDSGPVPVLQELASLLGNCEDEPDDGHGLELLEEIGRGGSGVVYRAHHRSLDRDLAVKMLIRGSRASGQELSRFRKEARALARLDHPGIVRVHDFGELDGAPFLAMELIAGPTLAERLRTGPLDIRLAARWARDLATAVAQAHAAGIQHRDLKPHNVLLAMQNNQGGSNRPARPEGESGDDSCQPKIVDFGLVRFSDGEALRTATGGVLGTPAYLAPEMMGRDAKNANSQAVDVYGLGTILYECLTGQPPYTGSSHAELLQAVSTQSPAPVRSIRPRVPPELAVICEKCLARDPGNRISSATELTAELTRFLDGRPILSRPPSIAGRVGHWCRRKPWQAVAVGLGLLLALGTPAAAIWHSWQLDREQRQAQQRYESARNTLWKMLDLFVASDVEAVPQVTSLMAREATEARLLFAELAEADPGSRAQLDLARVNMLCGTLAATLGRAEEAASRLDEALLICRNLRDDPEITDAALEQLAAALTKQGTAGAPDRDLDQDRKYLEEAVAIHRSLVRRDPQQPEYRSNLAWSLMNLGGWYQGQGQLPDALARTRESVAILERLVADGASDEKLKASLAAIRVNLASQLHGTGKTDPAAEQFRLAIAELERQLELRPASLEFAGDLAAALLNFSNLQGGSGDLDGAAESCSRAAGIVSTALKLEPEHQFLRQHLFLTTANRAHWLGMAMRFAEAELSWQDAIGSALDHGSRVYCQQLRVNCLAQDGRGAEAAGILREIDVDALETDALFRQALGWGLVANAVDGGDEPTSRDLAMLARENASAILRQLKEQGALSSEEHRNHLRNDSAWKSVKTLWNATDWERLTVE